MHLIIQRAPVSAETLIVLALEIALGAEAKRTTAIGMS